MTKLIIVGGFLGAGKTTLLLNASQHLTKRGKKVGLITNNITDWDKFIASFFNDLCLRFEKDKLPIGHVKAILESSENAVVANFTGGIDTISIRGSAGNSDKCKLTVNARVETTPENLDAITRAVLKEHTKGYKCTEIAWKYLQPGYPTPTHRFDKVM